MTETEPLVMYLLVRKDLKMGKGKIGAQCGHAVQELIMTCPKPILDAYRRNQVYAKICLQIQDEAQMDHIETMCKALGVHHHKVVDLGKTQVAPNTPTVLGIGPVLKSTIVDIVTDLKLL